MYVRLFFAFVLTGVLAAPAFADDAAALLQKHHAFVGWTLGDGAITSLRMQGTYAVPDAKPADVDDFQDLFQGLVEHRSLQSKYGGYDVGFTGTTFWRSSENGFVGRVLGDPAKYEVSRQIIFSEATTQLAGTMAGRKDIDGKSYPVVRVQFADKSFPIDLYVDEASGAYAREVIDPGGSFETAYNILEYKDVLPGKKAIARWRVDDSKAEYNLTVLKANEKLAAAALAPPPATAHWTFASDAPFPIHVTEQRIYVNAKVNGVEGSFTLDTGASAIALADSFAKRAHLTKIRTSEAGGIGGTIRTAVQKADTFEIGGNTLTNVRVDTGLTADPNEEGEDGLIGYDFLAGTIVDLDLDHKQMTIYDPAKMSPSRDSGISVVVDLSDGTPEVPMKLNNKIDVNATWDTGDAAFVLFSSDLVTKYGLNFFSDPSSLQSEMGITGIGGTVAAQCGNLDELRLGTITYASPQACKVSGDIADRYVLVGYDFLKHFNFVFDYPDSMIVLQPRK